MSWLKCYGLIVLGNGLINWILNDFIRTNDFEINWFNWCVGCKNIEGKKTLAQSLDNMVLKLKITKFQFGPLICENYNLVFAFWKNYRLIPRA